MTVQEAYGREILTYVCVTSPCCSEKNDAASLIEIQNKKGSMYDIGDDTF